MLSGHTRQAHSLVWDLAQFTDFIAAVKGA